MPENSEGIMFKKLSRTTAVTATLSAAVIATISPAPASAVSDPLSNARITQHFDLAKGQTPENITLAPGGRAYVAFAAARQVARISRTGTIRVLATLPLPADGGVHTPALGFPLTTGIARADDGTLYFLYATGTADLTGVWRLRPSGEPRRIAALPHDRPPQRPGPGRPDREPLRDRLRPRDHLEHARHRLHRHRLVHRPRTGLHRIPPAHRARWLTAVAGADRGRPRQSTISINYEYKNAMLRA